MSARKADHARSVAISHQQHPCELRAEWELPTVVSKLCMSWPCHPLLTWICPSLPCSLCLCALLYACFPHPRTHVCPHRGLELSLCWCPAGVFSCSTLCPKPSSEEESTDTIPSLPSHQGYPSHPPLLSVTPLLTSSLVRIQILTLSFAYFAFTV